MAETLPDSRREHLTEESEGQRVDWVLSRLPGIVSRGMAQRLIAGQHVRVNGELAKPDHAVHAGDVVDYAIPPSRASAVRAQAGPLRVLYEDGDLAVIDKPPGLAMHPGPGHADGTLVNFLLAHCGDLSGIGGTVRPGIVHRIDMDTSGVVVVAKNDAAHLGLAEQFKSHTIDRTYLALVLGQPREASGTVDLPLGRHRTHRVRRAVTERGKHAVTHWWVEQRYVHFTLLRLKLETGRTHQIRVHLAAQDWPVVGDPLYGGAARLKGLALPPEARATLLGFRRQALHAAELGFTHPGTGKRVTFTAPLPEDFRSLLAALATIPPPKRDRRP